MRIDEAVNDAERAERAGSKRPDRKSPLAAAVCRTRARRDAGAIAGSRRWRGRHSGERSETECGGSGRGGGARAENRLENPSRYAEGHLTYVDALKQSGYIGNNGVVVLSKRFGAERRQGAMGTAVDAAVDALVDISRVTRFGTSRLFRVRESVGIVHESSRRRH